MEEYAYIEILIEDQSGEILVKRGLCCASTTC